MRKMYTFDDVALVPQYCDISSRTEPDLTSWLTKYTTMKIPLLAANMDTVISERLADVLIANGSIPIFHRFTTQEDKIGWLKKYGGANIVISTGLVDENNDADLYELIVEYGAQTICIDVAHGHSLRMMKMIERLRKDFQDRKMDEFQIIAGNICTANAYIDLVNAGASSIKVGVGPGAACTTRVVTGFGIPQFSAIQQCAEQAHKYRIPLIADGGIRNSSDIVKALAAGASTVMIGKLFALTEESAAEKRQVVLPRQDSKLVVTGDASFIEADKTNTTPLEAKYRGQASKEFQEDYYGGLKDKTVAEGTSFWAEVSGPAQQAIDTLLGGIRSGLTYGGARSIKELQRKAEFVEVSHSYIAESFPRK